MRPEHLALTGILIGCALLGASSCGDDTTATGGPAYTVDYFTEGPIHPVGWLGGRTQAVAGVVTFQHGGRRRDTGGLVVQELAPSGPLATAGAKVDDVIVGIAEEWIPIKSDPWLDGIALVETAVSSGVQNLPVRILRSEQLLELEVPVAVKTLEEGLPLAVVRFDEGAARALPALRPVPGASLETLAWSGLARLAAGEPAETVALSVLSDGTADPADESLAVADVVAALMLETERLGPLPADIVTELSSRTAVFEVGPDTELELGDLGEILAGSIQVGGEGLPPDLAERIASGEGNVQVFQLGGSGGGGPDPDELREMLNLPEGAQITVMSGGGGELPGFPPFELPDGLELLTAFGTGPDLAALLEEKVPERLAAMEVLRPWIDRLSAMQREDGGWGGDREDRIRVTCDALTALAMAQRAGLEIPAETIELGVEWVRLALSNGEIAAHVARGGNRRDAVTRTQLAVRALRLLGCPDDDELMELLTRFLARAEPDDFTDPRDLLARALWARSGGALDWQRFYDAHRLQVVAAQDPDGSFHFDERPLQLENAIGTLLLSLQHARTPLLLGTASNPLAPPIDGHGKRPELPTGVELGGAPESDE